MSASTCPPFPFKDYNYIAIRYFDTMNVFPFVIGPFRSLSSLEIQRADFVAEWTFVAQPA